MAQKKRPTMPAASALGNAPARKGGLGRGLAALIPSGPQKPTLGNGAADVILGVGTPGAGRPETTPPSTPKAESGKERGAERGSGEAAAGTKSGRGSEGTKAMPASESRHRDNKAEGGSKGQNAEGNSEFGASYREIPLKNVVPNPKQPRSVFGEEELEELAHSIREFGVMQPIVVRPARGKGAAATYELIMGERRLRASERAGLKVIPAIVRETDDEAMLRDALLENIHRVQLNPLEEAAAYQQLLEEFGVTQTELATRLGRSRPVISNMIRLLSLPVAVQRRVGAGVLSAGHARALLGLQRGPEVQEKLAERIVAEGLSVRATEEAVTLLNRGEDEPERKKRRPAAPLPDHVNDWLTGFADALETKVTVQMGKKKGKLVVEFAGPEDFERIAEILQLDR